MSEYVYLVEADQQAVRAAVALLEADGHVVERLAAGTRHWATLKVVTGQDQTAVEGILAAMATQSVLLSSS